MPHQKEGWVACQIALTYGKEWAADGSSEHLRVSCHRQQSPTVCMLLILIKAHFCTPIAEYVEQSLTLIEPSCLLENAQVAT